MVDIELKKYGEKLLANGFRVFQHEKGSSWLTFGKNGNVGDVEHDPFRGYSFSTVHKPNTTTGEGFLIERELPNATINNANSTFIFVPGWASKQDRDSVVKYKNIDDWAKQSYLSNTELKKSKSENMVGTFEQTIKQTNRNIDDYEKYRKELKQRKRNVGLKLADRQTRTRVARLGGRAKKKRS